MEGLLCVPPERSSILGGKGTWKPRYVVLGPDPRRPSPTKASSSNRLKSKKARSPSSATLSPGPSSSDDLWLSIYKHKNDRELIASYALSTITSCSIEENAPLRSRTALSTLNVVITSPIRTETKRDKKSLSRTSTITLSRSSSKTLQFRNAQDDSGSVFDWYRYLRLNAANLESPTSSDRPSNLNIQPFSSSSHAQSRSTEASSQDSYRSSSSASSSRPSSNNRNNSLSSPESEDFPVSRNMHILDHLQAVSSAYDTVRIVPPAESILDRAFMQNQIPESDDYIVEEGSDKISSIARFEALMQQSDGRKAKMTDAVMPYPDPLPSPAQRALDFISARPQVPSPKARPARPTSVAYPSTSRSAALKVDDERRRSVISTSSSTKSRKAQKSDPSQRFSSTSTLTLSQSHTRNGSRDSRNSDEISEGSWEVRDTGAASLTARPRRGINFQAPAF